MKLQRAVTVRRFAQVENASFSIARVNKLYLSFRRHDCRLHCCKLRIWRVRAPPHQRYKMRSIYGSEATEGAWLWGAFV